MEMESIVGTAEVERVLVETVTAEKGAFYRAQDEFMSAWMWAEGWRARLRAAGDIMAWVE